MLDKNLQEQPSKEAKSPPRKDLHAEKRLDEDVKKETVGITGEINEEWVALAHKDFEKYKAGKKNLTSTIIENEEWYKTRHQQYVEKSESKSGGPEPASAWLLNSMQNKHADYMDNYPEPNVLAREQADESDALVLSQVIPVVLERNKFKKTYSDCAWSKLKHGSAVYGIFWNSGLDSGVGDIDIKQIDLLKIFWEPGITDLQKSKKIFITELADVEDIKTQYPTLESKISGSEAEENKYVEDDTIDTTGKTTVYDCYYKKTNAYGKEILCYTKYTSGIVLYASENDPTYKDVGWYADGMYPFVFDTLLPLQNSPVGFGYIAISKDPQKYIDKLDQAILQNSMMSSIPRYFTAMDININLEEFADFSKPFVNVSQPIKDDMLRPILIPQLPPAISNHLVHKIEELKETSGNRDFSQGGTASGVTAASAIAALQEAGSKLSRDTIQGTYFTFEEIIYMVLERIREYYDVPREFRVIGEGGTAEFVQYTNQNIVVSGPAPEMPIEDHGEEGELENNATRKPIFDIKISAQKSSPFNTLALNETAIQLWGMGVFRPELAEQSLMLLDMMEFDKKDQIKTEVAKNKQVFELTQQLQMQVQRLTEVVVDMDKIVTTTTGQSLLPILAQEGAIDPRLGGEAAMKQRKRSANPEEGHIPGNAGLTKVQNAREQASAISTPRSK